MEYKESLKWLYSLEPHEIKLGLSNTRSLLRKLGNPHKGLRCIHVAGTNGKGSVCAMIASILIDAGFKVGMYTSPHLVRFNERITVDNRPIKDGDIARLAAQVKRYYGSQTFFEATTALAFLYFKEQDIDYLVLEVGLGGRLDATNVVDPLVSVITNISIEHTDYLGKDIKSIAYEKAGIIKKERPVVTAADGEALDVIKKTAKSKNAKLFLAKTTDLETNLKGDFQKANAGIAVAVANILKDHYKIDINQKNIENGLKKAVWPGRFQFIENNILVDCAHNPGAIKVLRKELLNIIKLYDKKILVIGILKDKDHKAILKMLVPLFDKVIITRPSLYRALEPEIIAKDMPKKDLLIKKDVKEAVAYAKSIAKKDGLIVVTGSIYVVGEVFR